MRVALDTNVLVRFLVRDDEEQAARATEILASADTFVLPTLVLVELAWVLGRAYRFSSLDVARIISELIDSARVETDLDLFEAGLTFLKQGGDFADGCIVAQARRSRCDRVATFDKNFAKLGGTLMLDASHPKPA